jgi:hypothetical protein
MLAEAMVATMLGVRMRSRRGTAGTAFSLPATTTADFGKADPIAYPDTPALELSAGHEGSIMGGGLDSEKNLT